MLPNDYTKAQRKVIFRGKQVDSGKWVCGDLLQYDSGETAILKPFTKYGCEVTEIPKRSKVNPSTVGQLSGFTDAHGNRIFEDDILRESGCSQMYAVVYKSGCFHLRDYSCLYTHPLMDFRLDHWEVVGNIHDNPELIKMYIEHCKRHNL